jgi:hypothetical protein
MTISLLFCPHDRECMMFSFSCVWTVKWGNSLVSHGCGVWRQRVRSPSGIWVTLGTQVRIGNNCLDACCGLECVVPVSMFWNVDWQSHICITGTDQEGTESVWALVCVETWVEVLIAWDCLDVVGGCSLCLGAKYRWVGLPAGLWFTFYKSLMDLQKYENIFSF